MNIDRTLQIGVGPNDDRVPLQVPRVGMFAIHV